MRGREQGHIPDLCFGGRNNREQRLKNNNAFMLVFDRVGEENEDEDEQDEIGKGRVEGKGDNGEAVTGQKDPFLQQLCRDAGALDLPQKVITGIRRDLRIMSLSSILHQLWHSNVSVSNRSNIFGPDFFQFAWNSALVALEAGAVALKAEMLCREKSLCSDSVKRNASAAGTMADLSANRKLSRTRATKTMYSSQSFAIEIFLMRPSRRSAAIPPVDNELKSSLLLCTQMATSFLFHIFIRSSEVTMQKSTGYGEDVGNSAILSGPGFLRQSSDSQEQADVLRTLCRESSGHWFAMLEQILAMHEPSAEWFLEHVVACGNDYESTRAPETDEDEDKCDNKAQVGEECGNLLGVDNEKEGAGDGLKDSVESSSSRLNCEEEKYGTEVGEEDDENDEVVGGSARSSSNNNQEDDALRSRRSKSHGKRSKIRARQARQVSFGSSQQRAHL